jgi:N-acetyl-anhydromuramyl-L-alanine amidase AmpD
MKHEDIKYSFIHCSATNANQDLGAAEIDDMHKAKGWSGIGYHGVIKRDGTYEPGRPESKQGAHVGGFGLNHCSLGYCLIGGLLDGKIVEGFENAFTPEQENTLVLIIGGLRRKYPDAKILGHRDGSPDLDGDGVIESHEWVKQCPCFNVADFLEKHNIL